MPQYVTREKAREDVVAITSRIARDNLSAALRVNVQIENAFELLAEMPRAGPVCGFSEAELSDLRFWPIKRFRHYLVIYRPTDNGVEIVRVIHAARDFRRVLRG